MKKVILAEVGLLVLLALVMTLLLTKKDPRSDVTADEVQSAFSGVKGDVAIDLADELQTRKELDINPADCDMVVHYFSSTDSMYVYEFVLIRADEASMDSLHATLEEHVATKLEAFRGYGELQTELLEKAIIKQYGNYICLIITDEPEVWLNAVKALLEV